MCLDAVGTDTITELIWDADYIFFNSLLPFICSVISGMILRGTESDPYSSHS